MNVACDYEAPMQMLTTEKYIARRPWEHNNSSRWNIRFQYMKTDRL